jgi:hypothetical protein
MRRRSFRIRLVAMTAALVVVPLAVVGWVLIDVNRRALEDSMRDQLRTVVLDLARAGDRSLDDTEAILHRAGGDARRRRQPRGRAHRGRAAPGDRQPDDRSGRHLRRRRRVDRDGDRARRERLLLPATVPAELRARASGNLPAVGAAFTSPSGPRAC